MGPPIILMALAALLVIPVGIVAILYVIVPIFKGIGWLVRQVFRFVVGEVGDSLRFIGAIITQVILLPIIIVNILIGRWSAAAHFGRALTAECKTGCACVYRIVIGHPARLFCLTALTDGLEKRLPEVMAAAPTADTPSRRTVGQFDGYKIVGSLPGGGSGGKLYVAEPDAVKLAVFARGGRPEVRQVVIKTFSLKDGSSLPQIVRESRALEAAKRLGLVLEHELCEDRFYYVTEYVPGESLGLVTQRLHAISDKSLGDGLDEARLRQALGIGSDLLRTLDQYHRGGLWHKDVKPDNIIVDSRSAHLVDFGLVTPLRSGMTLTTHGTEYFRDPEMVRLALKGVKVHQVDGAKFDIYAAGSVLFSMVENSFPAHGGLSQITKRCPEALRWIVRRAMTDYDKRYSSAGAMMADLDVVRRASDPFAVKPFELPSMRGEEVLAGAAFDDEAPIRPVVVPVPVGAGSGAPAGFEEPLRGAAAASPIPADERQRPKIRVNRWWTGGYVVDDGPGGNDRDGLKKVFPGVYVAGSMGEALRGAAGFERPTAPAGVRAAAWTPGMPRRTAKEQVEHARDRARQARERARARMSGRRKPGGGDFRVMNAGVGMAVLFFLAVVGAFIMLVMNLNGGRGRGLHIVTSSDGQTFATIELPDGDSVRAAIRGAAESMHASADRTKAELVQKAQEFKSGRHPRVQVNGTVVSDQDVSPLPVMHGARALVISDVVPFPASVEQAVARLREAGFEVLGNYPGNPAEEVDQQRQLDLEAVAKQLRGLAPLTAPDVRQTLGEWVASEDLSLLVWFDRADPAKPAVRANFFSAAMADGTDAGEQEHGREALAAGLRAVRGE